MRLHHTLAYSYVCVLHNEYISKRTVVYICSSISAVSGEWSSPSETGTKPPPLSRFFFMKVDSRRAVVYGGGTGEAVNGDAYVLELDKWVRDCRWM